MAQPRCFTSEPPPLERAAAAWLRARLPPALHSPVFGIVCGSGLGGLVDSLDPATTVAFPYRDIPFFATSTVPGHKGELVFGLLQGQPTVVMAGRLHAYEGHAVIRTVFPIRVMRRLGVDVLILSNAAGGVNPRYKEGDLVVIRDHISLPGMTEANPLVGPNLDAFGERFPAVGSAYTYALREKAFEAALAIGFDVASLHEGVYCMLQGPSYETRAEARWLRSMGVDTVGMSTVPEVLVAAHAGMRVLALSLVTDMVPTDPVPSARDATSAPVTTSAAGTETVVTHDAVLAKVAQRSAAIEALVRQIVCDVAASEDATPASG
ncbi:hypothetical protein CXG81DRAFT_29969 [Caulochytrium protostelioides]|uniref:Purine nucleoside phosphorylase n=1 Tax=Caulochytrium protostelioides TaxID=1555241 RepID=A0A4V1IUG1_9FUNG|nr:hypothetical protein CXG81DRAFT_29969 [Caulochytrium protostelioides]|eukprot:RKP00439.1 hypothetical protein CXG81DRAFT_29969 [Caulochytrium protostelioides]